MSGYGLSVASGPESSHWGVGPQGGPARIERWKGLFT